MNKKFIGLGLLIISSLALVSCNAFAETAKTSPSPTVKTSTDADGIAAQTTGDEIIINERVDRDYSQFDIITLLAPDGIPSIDAPQFLSSDEADKEYAPDELILGVSFNGDSRAYSVNLLSSHEIVNDTVGGRPISVTW